MPPRQRTHTHIIFDMKLQLVKIETNTRTIRFANPSGPHESDLPFSLVLSSFSSLAASGASALSSSRFCLRASFWSLAHLRSTVFLSVA